jgi:YspA, cpYpsA-related SLOG family
MRVLVCGGRDFNNPAWLNITLNELSRDAGWTTIIEGGARGADRQAREWALDNGLDVQTFDADWHAHGRAAGPLRNQRMLDEGQPDLVVAFPGGRGTADMVRQARARGITVHEFQENACTVAMRPREARTSK